jgi:hypothetical protein
VYEHSSSTLTIKVKFTLCHLSTVKSRGWIPFSDLYSKVPDAVEAGNIFPHDGNMMIIVQYLGGARAKVYRIDTPDEYRNMNITEIAECLQTSRS